MHNTEAADNIWLTCCALHNMLLDVDGLSAGWNNSVLSDWELDSGDFKESDLPDSIRRLIDPTRLCKTGGFCLFLDISPRISLKFTPF